MATLKIKTEEVVFTSKVKQGEYFYTFTTEIKEMNGVELVEIRSSSFIEPEFGTKPTYGTIVLHRLKNIDDAIAEVIEFYSSYQLELKSRILIQDFEQLTEPVIPGNNIVWNGTLKGLEYLEIEDYSIFKIGKTYKIILETTEIKDQKISVLFNKYKVVNSSAKKKYSTVESWKDVYGDIKHAEKPEHAEHYFYKRPNENLVFDISRIGLTDNIDVPEHSFGEIKTTILKIRSSDKNSTDKIVIKEI